LGGRGIDVFADNASPVGVSLPMAKPLKRKKDAQQTIRVGRSMVNLVGFWGVAAKVHAGSSMLNRSS